MWGPDRQLAVRSDHLLYDNELWSLLAWVGLVASLVEFAVRLYYASKMPI